MDHYWMEFDIKPSPWWRNRDMEGTGGIHKEFGLKASDTADVGYQGVENRIL